MFQRIGIELSAFYQRSGPSAREEAQGKLGWPRPADGSREIRGLFTDLAYPRAGWFGMNVIRVKIVVPYMLTTILGACQSSRLKVELTCWVIGGVNTLDMEKLVQFT
jgi:hypothetical protein